MAVTTKPLGLTHVIVTALIGAVEIAINYFAMMHGVVSSTVEFSALMSQNMIVLPTASYFTSKIQVGNLTEQTTTP